MTKPKSIPLPTTLMTTAFAGDPPGQTLAALADVDGNHMVLAEGETLVVAPGVEILKRIGDDFEVISNQRFYLVRCQDVVKTKTARPHRKGTIYLRSTFQAVRMQEATGLSIEGKATA